jgi:protein involved in plasmid replication-relaxation
MTPSRLTTARLRQLTEDLPTRYTAALTHLRRARVLTGHQLDRLLAKTEVDPHTTARVRRRIMGRLDQLGLVRMLERRIGGMRAGSTGHVYVLTPAGHTFLALLHREHPPPRIRHFRAPSILFLNHTLAIAEVYVALTEASRHCDFGVATFTTEPSTWWPLGNGFVLRPDAYTVLTVATHRDCWWLEIDRATESRPRLTTKCNGYLAHATSGGTGPDGVPPHVLFTAPTPHRCTLIADLITGLPPPAQHLFSICLHTRAVDHLITALHDQ